jgi:hypothetical protein
MAVNRHGKGGKYGLALRTGNIFHCYCDYIYYSWIYRPDSMDNWKVDYYHRHYPRADFPDYRKIRNITVRGILTAEN